MRKTFSGLLSLLALAILPAGLALSQEPRLRPLPMATGSLMTETFTAAPTDQAGLQRAGYVLQDRDSGVSIADMRERSYTFDGLKGISATLTDKEFPANAPGKRELVFEVFLSVRDGGSANDLAAITPGLVAAARRAMSQSAAVVAGLGYLATASASSVTPEALQATVIDYLREYRQPKHSPREACLGCGSLTGFSDDYSPEPGTYVPLKVRETGWTIAGIRHSLKGESVFRLEVVARIPRT
jgi:hypothetical protein